MAKQIVLPVPAGMPAEEMKILEERTNYFWNKVATILDEENASNREAGLVATRMLLLASQDSNLTLEQVLQFFRAAWELNEEN